RAWERGMSAVAVEAPPARRGSISGDRKKAMYWSYFFLMLFVLFFLTPPLYMLVMSLKTSGEIAEARFPWWVFHPTLDNYWSLLGSENFQNFFINSALLSTSTVEETKLISIPAAFSLSRMKFW